MKPMPVSRPPAFVATVATVATLAILVIQVMAAPVSAQRVDDGQAAHTARIRELRQLRPPAELQQAFTPTYIRRDLTVFAEELALEPHQLEIITSLFNDYNAAYTAGAKAARAEMNTRRPQRPRSREEIRGAQDALRREIESMRDDARERAAQAPDAETRRRIMDEYERQLQARMRELEDEMAVFGLTEKGRSDLAEAMEAMAAIARVWRETGDQLGRQFVQDALAILDEPQRARWPRVERRLRREKTIVRGRLSGESVDLAAIVRGLEIDDATRGDLDELLTSYEVRLDEALRARNEHLQDTGDRLYEATHQGDAARVAALAARRVELHRAVRDVNEDFANAIESALPEEPAAAFRVAANRAGFARLYRATPTTRLLRAATRLTGLDAEQQEAVAALEREYLVLLRERNERLRRTILEHEPLVQQRRAERLGSGRDGGRDTRTPGEDPIRAAFEARRVFGEGYLERLRQLLTEEQLDRLPGAARGAVTHENGDIPHF